MTKNLITLGKELGFPPDHLFLYGTNKAKISLDVLRDAPKPGRLILVSAITPTPAGEGKTTVAIGLAQGIKRVGKTVALALREPSMGPVFGRKGGATGGGKSSLTPSEEINLHFTGDFHAITSANNLLSALVDNALHFQTTRLDPGRVHWKRVLDMNDRALRSITTCRGTETEQTTGFNITAASEIMAILCLAESLEDLRNRLNRIVVGFTPEGKAVYAREFAGTGAMLALLRDALMPNLVQSLEGVPALVHGGPFANIAHGCNSALATRMAMAGADFTVTEAGFAFDLGGEKFMSIKCRQTGLAPDVIVLVATIRALKMHGGVSKQDLTSPNIAAVQTGLENLDAHLEAAKQFQRPVLVGINRFEHDSAEELEAVLTHCRERNIPCACADAFGKGGAGSIELANIVLEAMPKTRAALPFLYQENDSIEQKLTSVATRVYGADGVTFTEDARNTLALFEKEGFDRLPVCMAKTQNSLSDNGRLRGRPRGFTITVRDFEIANGAGFLIALTGSLMRMPALPRNPAAARIDVSTEGLISGV